MPPASLTEQYPSRDMFGKTVTVRVGKGIFTTSFTLHQGVLCFYSGYFEAALKGNFKEAQNNLIDLPAEDVSIFEHFVGWLYTRRVDVPKGHNQALDVICALWILADRGNIPLLADQMMDSFRDAMVEYWQAPTNQLHDIYSNTMPGAKLRRFAVFVMSRTCGPKLFADNKGREKWPEAAMWDMMGALMAMKTSMSPKSMDVFELAALDMCPFHQHGESVKCRRG